jgi:three-Cys-motif partner protein
LEENGVPRRLDDYEWTKSHVSQLMALGQICVGHQPEVYNEFGAWTALKLCALKNYVDIYTRIMDDKRLHRLGFNGRAYLDVFAGSGVDLIRETGTPLAGSTPTAANFHYDGRPFHEFYAVEIKREFCEALKERMAKFVSNDHLHVVRGNADEKIGQVIDDIESKNMHYLAFIDYEGIKGFGWENLELLLQKKGDLWITFICPGLARVQGRARWSSADEETLANMVGWDVVKKSEDLDDLMRNFIQKLRRYRKNVVEMFVRSGEGYYYELIFATRETQGGSGYVTSVENLKKRLASTSGDFVQHAVRVLEGKAKDLNGF